MIYIGWMNHDCNKFLSFIYTINYNRGFFILFLVLNLRLARYNIKSSLQVCYWGLSKNKKNNTLLHD